MDHPSSDLQNKLFHRDKLLQSLQEQTSLLMEQHSNTLREVSLCVCVCVCVIITHSTG